MPIENESPAATGDVIVNHARPMTIRNHARPMTIRNPNGNPMAYVTPDAGTNRIVPDVELNVPIDNGPYHVQVLFEGIDAVFIDVNASNGPTRILPGDTATIYFYQ